jgi:anti-sigma factor RsiW
MDSNVTHGEVELQLDAYVDGELAPGDARELETHLKACAECARLHEARVALSATIREQVPAFRAPDALRGSVRAALRNAAGTPVPRRLRAPVAARWLALAASLAVVAAGSWRLGLSRAGADALAGQVLASHVRSLMPGHLTDVVSSDQHTVKPWFNGKLDFSPQVYDFAGRGFPLVGGRLDYLGERPVAALVYARRQHLINVFLWPAKQGPGGGDGGAGVATRRGYHLLHWTTPDYAYWVVSDLGMPELHDFAQLVQQADSAAGRPAAASGLP